MEPGDQPKATVRIPPLAAAVVSGFLVACVVVVLWFSPKALVAVSAGVGYATITYLAHHISKGDDNGR